MTLRTRYLASVTLGALVCAAVLYWSDPTVPAQSIGAVVVLSTLALFAEALVLVMPNSVLGSVAFIPYLATALVVPNWIALIGVVVVRFSVDLASRRPAYAVIFNVGQHAVTFASAVLVFRVLGGQGMNGLAHMPLAKVTLVDGMPSLAAFVLSFAVNSTLICGYLAAKSGRGFTELWRGTFLSTIGL